MNEWPADKVERCAVEALLPYARNARTHSDEQVDQIAASIREWGWTTPVLVDEDNQIIAGHGRILAARKLGLTEVPVIRAIGWSKAQKQAYVLADNKLALNAGWDMDMLKVELQDLQAADFDTLLVGFSEKELLDICNSEVQDGLTDPDATPKIGEKVVSRPGDIWILGGHRLLCGDSTNADGILRLLGDVVPHLMVTDPPYGVEYDPNWRMESGKLDNKTPRGAVMNDDRANWSAAWDLFPGDVAYVWHSGMHVSEVQQSLEDSGFLVRAHIVWRKQHFVISRGHYHWGHESCWYAVRKGKDGHWAGDRSQTTVWDINKIKLDLGHGTQKPVECMQKPMLNNSNPGQCVYDPFLGSGTTIIAAQQINRRCFGVELNPLYADLAIRRWQEFTGQQAYLEDKENPEADRVYFDNLIPVVETDDAVS